MKPLPLGAEQLVKVQDTIAISMPYKQEAESVISPIGSHWYRVVAAMLLSGRVAAKMDGSPNRTDRNRICKEATFKQYFFERIAKFVLATKVNQDNCLGHDF